MNTDLIKNLSRKKIAMITVAILAMLSFAFPEQANRALEVIWAIIY